MRQCVRLTDYVAREGSANDVVLARLGGDEFTVTLVDLKDPQDAAKVASRILEEMVKPFFIGGQEFNVSASVGISVYPENGHDAETLLKNADAAMYQAKAIGRNALKFFADDMNAAALEKLNLENELKHAIERNEFRLHYQPKIDVHSGSIVGVEALIRWQHPRRGLVMPGVFIELAEERGLIVPIGKWVLDAACSQLVAWRGVKRG